MQKSDKQAQNRIHELEAQLSELKLELENIQFQAEKENEKKQFYQLIADFTFGWELWFEPNGKIKYPVLLNIFESNSRESQ